MQTSEPLEIKDQGAEFWNGNPCGGRWKSYREFMDWIQSTEPYIFRILDRYPWAGRKVLEVGCGQGTTLNYLPQFGAAMFGLDMSLQSIRQAKSGAVELDHLHQIRLSQADAERLPFPDEVFDTAISIGVLHHTVDTLCGIHEIHRLLRPGGIAIIMLYRSGNPKWWITRLLRTGSWLVARLTGRRSVLESSLRERQETGSSQGTALLELFGVPILKAFSNHQARKMFAAFSEVQITNHQPGFRRMADILPFLRPFDRLLRFIDKGTTNIWGFYQVIEARK